MSNEAAHIRQAKFIAKAATKYGNTYDYSKVIYTDQTTQTTNVEIICNKHHLPFWQSPAHHMDKDRIVCSECRKEHAEIKIKIEFEKFKHMAIKIHDNKYDYSSVVYKNAFTKIEIKCTIHGSFWQIPNNHTSKKSGCPDCGFDRTRFTTNKFIENAYKIHHNKYDYSKVVYKNANIKVEVICNIHKKSFWVAPRNHINQGTGCPDCNIDYTKLSKDDFVNRARAIHGDKYDYSNFEYQTYKIKGEIVCNIHKKSFWQTPSAHIGIHPTDCPLCAGSSISKAETQWLDSKNISDKNRNINLYINGQRYNVDAYIPSSKTIYEFYGDYWHGNPNKFDTDKINQLAHKTFGELYKATIDRENIFISVGYKVISIWEDDWNKKLQKDRNKKKVKDGKTKSTKIIS